MTSSRGAAPHDKMAVQGFKGSRAIESEEAEYKGLVRGLLLGCALPSVMLCVFLWNTGVSTNIVSKDVGAPIEVMERMKAIEGLEPKAARKARSRRFEVLRRLHFVDVSRLHERRRWVVSFSSLRPFGL